MRSNILVIAKSDYALRGRVISALIREGFGVATATGTEEVLSRLGELKPWLIILGEGLPIDSFKACSQLRQAVDVPILMVGTIPSNKAWTKAVEVGADFYLVKPFSYPELVARVKALLRRYEQTKNKNDKEEADHVEA